VGAILGAFSYWEYRNLKVRTRRFQELRPQRTSYAERVTMQLVKPSSMRGAFQSGLLFITDKEIVIYPEKDGNNPLLSFRSDEIIGYWRPRPYHADKFIDTDIGWQSRHGNNEINIHALVDNQWAIIKLWVSQKEAKKIINRLKGLVNEDILRSNSYGGIF
jgi:hypothetical protein